MTENLNSKETAIYQRIKKIISSEEIQRGLQLVSDVGHITEQVLYDLGIPNLWLPPIDTSIAEYTKNDFIVLNPLNNKTYSLIQSPQIMKEVAAIAFGSNWRRTTCFRPEPGDATHAQMFQQIDVELKNSDGKQARSLASKLFLDVCEKTLGISQNTIPEYTYQSLIEQYGEDSPNLYLENHNLNNSSMFAYWVTDIPFASWGRNGKIKPTHHVMSLPNNAVNNPQFSFNDYTDDELTHLSCDSYDLVVCNDTQSIEIAGGDRRISTVKLQLDAIDRFGEDRQKYAILLEALKLNERNMIAESIVGFAFGIERLTMVLGNISSIDNIQVFPTNSPTGDFIHTTDEQ